MMIAGESLFNDGMAVTLFLLLLPLVGDGPTPGLPEASMMLVREVLGGIVFGALAGWIALRLLRQVNEYTVEILITLAMVSGGFALNSLKIMIWAGLRGGLSVAMALSLPAGPGRDLIVAITYGIVVFGFLVQGTTITRLLRWDS